jgi:hypothetical protein
MLKPSWNQHASGEFSVDIVAGTKHCGLDDSRGHFRYEVNLCYTGDALDSNRFLLDNTDFQRYFQGLGPIGISCEEVARGACQHFQASLGERSSECTRVAVKIYPFGDVYVEHVLSLSEET